MARRRRSASFSLERYDGSSSELKHVWLVGSRLLSGPSRCVKRRGAGAACQGWVAGRQAKRGTHSGRPACTLPRKAAAYDSSDSLRGCCLMCTSQAHLDDAAQVAQPADGRAVGAGEELEEELALLLRQLAHHLPQPLHHAVLCGRERKGTRHRGSI